MRHHSLKIGVAFLLLILCVTFIGPLFSSVDPNKVDPSQTFLAPSAQHWFGTDSFGRDMFARVLEGGRVTVLAGAAVVVLGGAAGTLLGLIAGYYRGAVGFLIMRLTDLLLAFPGILLALAAGAVLGPGLRNGVLAVAVVVVPIYVRVVEGATREIRKRPYVDAAVTTGAGSVRIILRHVLPNVRSGLLVLTTTWLGYAALWIAALGFIGMGVQPPTPEWGALLSDGRNYVTLAWWIGTIPGIFLALFVIAVNLIGDGLRDELDPALARR
ncbi:ABC transporter permease [Kribbella sp. NPDC050124]|uniref:ABC transporter permease n=1 Tax=Kribbella sp. NPDC050124 TaxID=3364114 RepID=UPI0037ADCEA1